MGALRRAAACNCRMPRRPHTMVVNTRYLFTLLLSALDIDTICDVGSMDGDDALRFRRARPAATIYALEPHPDNYRKMSADGVLQRRSIRVAPVAAAESDGEADFFLVHADENQRDRRGMSSLYERAGASAPRSVVKVRTTRIDTFLAGERSSRMRLALWIDAEGKAHEVIEGARGTLEGLLLLHVELETTPCIGAAQKLYPDVKALLHGLSFFELATDQPNGATQFNAVFVRRGLPNAIRLWIGVCLVRARLRHLTFRLARRACPAGLRHLQALKMNLRYRAGYSSRGTTRAS